MKKRCSWDSLPPHYSVCSFHFGLRNGKSACPAFSCGRLTTPGVISFVSTNGHVSRNRRRACVRTNRGRRSARVPFVSAVTITSIVPLRICISHLYIAYQVPARTKREIFFKVSRDTLLQFSLTTLKNSFFFVCVITL